MSSAVGEMFINLTIIISFLTFGNYFIRDKGTSNPDKLEEHADIALYNSKRTGRNKVSVYGG